MIDGHFHTHDKKLLFGLLCVLALACAPTRTRPTGESSGGAGGSGGVSDSGGSLGNGGDPVASGGDSGSSSGGAGEGGAGGGGTIGTGGTQPTNIPCTGDSDCTATRQVCDTSTKLCVSSCVNSVDCPPDGHCLGSRCVTFTACGSNTECTGSSEKVCDTTRGVCVQCNTETDCGSTGKFSCTNYKCVAVQTCKLSTDCTGPLKVCDTANGVCIDCATTCADSKQICVHNVCRTKCTTKADCSSLGMVCDTSNSACVQCLVSSDCPEPSWYCLVNSCVPDVCDANQSMCASATTLAFCNKDGDAFQQYTSCPASKPCAARGASGSCGGATPPKDGGAGDAPISPRDGGAGSCSGGTMSDPCKSGIPKFSGTQTVDGNGTEMCSLPYFQLNAQNAIKILNYNNVPTSQFESATARIAWDSAGFHAFVEVQDSSVQTVNMVDTTQAIGKAYLGDSIELFISSSNNVTGLTSSDSNTLHIIVPANGPAVSVKDTGSSGTETALPAGQFAQGSTGTGYTIEVLIPWPGSAPSTGTAVRFDMALNSAHKTTSTDKMRDGQLEYSIGTLSGSSTCQTSDGTVPWCDDRTWCQANIL